jgi:ABC-2 type transport system permease protein
MIRSIKQTLAFAAMTTIPAIRNPFTHLFLALFPLIMLYTYTIVGGSQLAPFVLIGSLVSTATNAGIVNLPQKVVEYRTKHLQEMFVASPMRPAEFFLGLGLSRCLLSMPIVIVIVAILLYTRQLLPHNLPSVCVIILSCSLFSSAFGFLVASYLNSPPQVSAVANLLGLLLVLLPPVYYPSSLLKPWLGHIYLLLPTSAAASLLRHNSALRSSTMTEHTWQAWLALSGYTILFLWLASRRSQWRES